MASHKTVHGPIDPASPQGYTTFAVRVNPKAFFKSGITPADYRVPPFSMVFAKIPSEKDRGFDGSRVVHVSKKARRDPPVPDVICNFFDINNRADKTFTENSLRFIGISYDGVADARGAEKFPDKVGRFSVIASGKVTFMCNKENLQNIHVGDLIGWEFEDNKQVYHGLPSKWSTAKLVNLSSGGSGAIPLRARFDGSITTGIQMKDFQEKENRELARTAAAECMKLFQRSEVKKCTPTNPADTLSKTPLTYDADHPKDAVAPYAIFFLSLVLSDAEITASGGIERNDWEYWLYDKKSPYWCEEENPVNPTSPLWIMHFIGNHKAMWMEISDDGSGSSDKFKLVDDPANANCFCSGLSLGWLHRVFIPLIDTTDTKYKWAYTEDPRDDKFKYTSGEDWTNYHVGGSTDTKEIQKFLKLYGMKGQFQDYMFRRAKAACTGLYHKNDTISEIALNIGTFGKTEQEFDDKRKYVTGELKKMGIQFSIKNVSTKGKPATISFYDGFTKIQNKDINPSTAIMSVGSLPFDDSTYPDAKNVTTIVEMLNVGFDGNSAGTNWTAGGSLQYNTGTYLKFLLRCWTQLNLSKDGPELREADDVSAIKESAAKFYAYLSMFDDKGVLGTLGDGKKFADAAVKISVESDLNDILTPTEITTFKTLYPSASPPPPVPAPPPGGGTGGSGTVSQADYDDLKNEYNKLKLEKEDLKRDLRDLKSRSDAASSTATTTIANLTAAITEKESRIKDLEALLAARSSISTPIATTSTATTSAGYRRHPNLIGKLISKNVFSNEVTVLLSV